MQELVNCISITLIYLYTFYIPCKSRIVIRYRIWCSGGDGECFSCFMQLKYSCPAFQWIDKMQKQVKKGSIQASASFYGQINLAIKVLSTTLCSNLIC